jgi:pimeloyl-ACP methyl ester carboxylesterase
MFADATFWQPVVDRLLTCGHTCVVPPLPRRRNNNNDNDGTTDLATFADWMDAAEAALTTALGSAAAPEDVVVVGHSMGTVVARKLLHEGKCQRAVFINASPGFGELAPVWQFRFLLWRGRFWNEEVHLTRDQAKEILFQGMHTDEQVDAEYKRIVPESGHVLSSAFWGFDLLKQSTRVPAPVPGHPGRYACLGGALDPIHHGPFMAPLLEGAAKVVVLTDAGHFIPREKPTETADFLHAFALM